MISQFSSTPLRWNTWNRCCNNIEFYANSSVGGNFHTFHFFCWLRCWFQFYEFFWGVKYEKYFVIKKNKNIYESQFNLALIQGCCWCDAYVRTCVWADGKSSDSISSLLGHLLMIDYIQLEIRFHFVVWAKRFIKFFVSLFFLGTSLAKIYKKKSLVGISKLKKLNIYFVQFHERSPSSSALHCYGICTSLLLFIVFYFFWTICANSAHEMMKNSFRLEVKYLLFLSKTKTKSSGRRDDPS